MVVEAIAQAFRDFAHRTHDFYTVLILTLTIVTNLTGGLYR
jgi:hypothetical protein